MFESKNTLMFAGFALLIRSAAAVAIQRLPIVDLGYQLHQAASFNDTGGYYNFTNIRYAAPPLGDLRFAAPQPPAVNRSAIETGSIPRLCPQAPPGWLPTALPLMSQYTAGLPINVSSSSPVDQPLPPIDPRTTEDCLFLDVMVPEEIFEAAEDGTGAPVLVWIHGGGYTVGEKATSPLSNPGGLFRRSNSSMIFVALNYRLGAFGWLSGSAVQRDGTANVGLLDQRLALEWVRENIARFGGDPNRVTVMGESAGAGSIAHQITAYGGQEGKGAQDAGVPFSQAILQSTGWYRHPSLAEQDQLFARLLAPLNVSTLQEARRLPAEALVRANMAVLRDTPYGTFSFGPTIDGDFVPSGPAVSLRDGRFDPNVTILIGHNSDEGVLFTPPNATDASTFAASVLALHPSMTPENLDYVSNTLYPAVFDGTYGYTDPYRRTSNMRADAIIVCKKLPVLSAYQTNAYSYQFSLPPGLHGVDLEYTFYDDGGIGPFNSTTLSGVLSEEAVHTFQRWIGDFVTSGQPRNVDGVLSLPYPGHDANASTVDLNVTGVSIIKEYAAGSRCAFWNSLEL